VALKKRDPHTGYLTTGHEWNGITELNTPVPRAVYVFLTAAALFAVAYWILMPAWPLGTTYTKGLLGIDERSAVAQATQEAARARGAWTARIASGSFDDIRKDRQLMEMVRQSGRTLFGDNCAACHGPNARGARGFPDLTAASMLWGDTPEAIAQTIRVGINSEHPETRSSQMPAFGHDGMLARKDVETVVAYVRSLSGAAQAKDEAVAAGEAIFSANCAACHGERGTGNVEVGAPDLTDRAWIYGGDLQTVHQTVWGGRQGQMPTWESRLSELDRKILTLYLLDLRAARR